MHQFLLQGTGLLKVKPDSVDITEVFYTGGGAKNTSNCLSKNVLEKSFKNQLKWKRQEGQKVSVQFSVQNVLWN